MKKKIKYWFSSFVLFFFASFFILQNSSAQRGIREIHQERSLYRNIIVTEDSTRRCLRFTMTRRTGQNQSCRFLENPQELVFPYAKMTLSSLLVQAEPQRILIIGLGGGTLPEVYHTLFPEAEIIISEIDEAVLRVAEDFFEFEQTDKIKVDIGDGRVYVKRAALRNESFDLVIIDAFNGEYIPEHLMTEEFLEEIKSLLPEDGMLVSNTFSTSRLYDAESQTYHNVFGEFINLRMNNTGNRIIIASRQELPGLNTLNRRAANWRNR
ncbi:fused MFS/spermidine synthase, partial [Haliea sp. AH-315-K21]|nr:fused MFS/spermidine synthase [Haliea sp. AH-315-K21]